MRAICDIGGRLTLTELPTPQVGPGEVCIRVRATAVNRADLLQRAGHYPPPQGASDILGLECAGQITQVGSGVPMSVGMPVCALLSGGGYATDVVVPYGQVLPLPEGIDFEGAAALPEALCTAHDALVTQADLTSGERVVLHAGASGIGTAAIQLCKALGAHCFVTTGSAEKVAKCVELGADGGANRHEEDWRDTAWVAHGVDVILDPVGAPYLDSDLRALRNNGRLVVIGLMGGRRAELDLGRLMVKRLRILGTVLRSRSAHEKANVVAAVRREVWPWVSEGRIRPIIHATMPLENAEEAHKLVASNATFGKVVLVA
jgi:putative PIG3 family NAD(P)H quinone oxidoreductase